MPPWVTSLVGILFTGLVGGSFLSYVLERTRKKAQGLVATKTVDAMVDAAELTNEAARMQLIEDRLELIDEANRQERESLSRTIGNLRESLTGALTRLQQVEQELVDLNRRHRVAIGYIRLLLAHINEHAPESAAPPIPDGLDLNA
jgi:polyhydroxyalkanoate synthesis regulator phasin